MTTHCLIYGANGFTGELIARLAAAKQLPIVLGGRRAEALAPLANALNCPFRVFSLDHPEDLGKHLGDIAVVLNCAGPFSKTALVWAQACIRHRIHYLDITGEYAVFEALHALDQAAQQAGVMLLPGVGFDVVPTDCLAAHLHQLHPNANRLCLGLKIDMIMSPGTAVTTVESMGRPSLVRRGGRLVPVPMGSLTRRIDFGEARPTCVALPLGDISTAFFSTGIPDIEVYTALPLPARLGMRASGVLAPLLRTTLVQTLTKSIMRSTQRGPSQAQRTQGRSLVWGEVSDGHKRHASLLSTPDHYEMTAQFAVNAAAVCLGQCARPGYQTPSSALGKDHVLQFQGVTRLDLPG